MSFHRFQLEQRVFEESQKPSKDFKTLTVLVGSDKTGTWMRRLFFTYKSLDTLAKFFQRVHSITLKQKDVILHQWSGVQWSVWHMLHDSQVLTNRADSQFHIPLPVTGICADLCAHPLQISIEFPVSVYQEEQNRCGVLYQTANHLCTAAHYWTMDQHQECKIATSQKQIQIPVTISASTTHVGGVVFLLPGANRIVKGGQLVDLTDQAILQRFESNYVPAYLDKAFFGMPLPKQPLFTCTLSDWQNHVPQETDFPAHNVRLDLEVDQEDVQEDFGVTLFAIVGRSVVC